MSDAEKAWQAWIRKNIPEPFVPPSELSVVFFAGYAAASANTARLVRAAVEATKEEAARQVASDLQRGTPYPAGFYVRDDIRALDVDAIVKRAMQEVK